MADETPTRAELIELLDKSGEARVLLAGMADKALKRGDREKARADQLERELDELRSKITSLENERDEAIQSKDVEAGEAATQQGIARSLATLLAIDAAVPDYELEAAARWKLNEVKDAVEGVLENTPRDTSAHIWDLINAARELGWRE